MHCLVHYLQALYLLRIKHLKRKIVDTKVIYHITKVYFNHMKLYLDIKKFLLRKFEYELQIKHIKEVINVGTFSSSSMPSHDAANLLLYTGAFILKKYIYYDIDTSLQ